ncbi:MAG TPA: tetratricopeptide repeat protein [Stenomitos sp.]
MMSRHEFVNSFAIIIGINNYTNGVPQLKTAVPDAEKLARMLEADNRGDDRYIVKRLLNQEANFDNLKRLLDDLKQKRIRLSDDRTESIGEKDRLLFYFAGHGYAPDAFEINKAEEENGAKKGKKEDLVGFGYLLPQDATGNNIQISGNSLESNNLWLPMQRLRDAIAELDCRHLLVILDCCFAGAFRSTLSRDIVAAREVYKERYERFIKHEAWHVITSAAHDQKAIDSLGTFGERKEQNGHSPFALALFDALSGQADISPPGGDGIITALELYVYLRDSQDIYIHQTPGWFPFWADKNKKGEYDKGEYIFLTPKFDINKLKDAPALKKENNSYRGLNSYEENNAELFFGREKLIEELCDRILSPNQQITVVVGASGSGKSSLVKAGLIPCMKEKYAQQWHVFNPIRPGEFPFETIRQISASINSNKSDSSRLENEIRKLRQQLSKKQKKILVIGQGTSNLDKKITEIHQLFSNIITNWEKANPNKQLLLVIDQFEELITLCQQSEMELFLKFLARLLKDKKLNLILTLRSDFEPRFLDSDLKDYWNSDKARFLVRAMSSEELRQAIEGPALANMLDFEPPQLVNKLIDEVRDMPGALPLLSFTLSELYIKCVKDSRRTITEKDYNDLGGVINSLTKRATEEYNKLDKVHQATMRRLMLRMVTIEGGESARRRVSRSELIYPSAEENKRVDKVIKLFCDEARLIVVEKKGNETYVEPAHDALIQGWDKLQQWIKNEQETLILQRRLTSAAEDWYRRKVKDDAKLPHFVRSLLGTESFIYDKFQYWQRKKRPKIKFKKKDSKLNFNISRAGLLSLSEPKPLILILCLYPTRTAQQRREKSIDYLWHNEPRLAQLSELLDSNENWFNDIEDKFVRQSIVQKGKVNFKRWSRVRVIALIVTILAIIALIGRRNAQIGEIRASLQSAQANLLSSNDLEAIVDILRARKLLKGFWFKPEAEMAQVRVTLYRAFYQVRERNRLQLDLGNVYDVALSPNGRRLAAVGKGDTVIVWDLSGILGRHKSFNQFRTEHDRVYSVAFISDDKLATGGRDGTLKLWKIKSDGTAQKLAEEKKQESVYSMAFGSDCQQLATGGEKGTLKVWKIENDTFKTGLQLQEFPTKQGIVYSVAFSRDCKQLATVGADGMFRLWEKSGKQIIPPFLTNQDGVRSIGFNPDGEVATGGRDGTVKLWDIKDIKENKQNRTAKRTIETEQGIVYGVAFSNNGKLATLGSDGTIIVRHKLGYKDQIQLPVESVRNNNVAFSPNGKTLAVGGEDGTVWLWQASSGKLIRRFQTDQGHIISIVFNPTNGERLIALGSNKLREWDTSGNLRREIDTKGALKEVKNVVLSHGGILATVKTNGRVLLNDIQNPNAQLPQLMMQSLQKLQHISSFAFSRNGNQLAIGEKNGKVWLGDIEKNGVVWRQNFPIETQQGAVTSLALSSDDKLATVGTDSTLKLWDTSDVPRRLRTQTGSINAVSFSLDGKQLATVGADGTVRLWDTLGNQPILCPTQQGVVSNMAFSSDGKQLATVGENGTLAWCSDQQPNQFSAQQGVVSSIAFSPDRKVLAIGGKDKDGTVWLEDASGNPFDEIKTDQGVLHSVAFSSDGEVLATIGQHNTLKLWKIEEQYKLMPLDQFPTKLEGISSVAFSSKDKLVATGDNDGVKLWKASGKPPNEIPTQQGGVTSVAFSLDGKLLATGGKDGSVRLGDTSGNQFNQIQTLQHTVISIVFSPDGTLLATLGKDKSAKNGNDNSVNNNTLRMWDISRKDLRPLDPSPLSFHNVAFSPDGKLLAVSDNNSVKLWKFGGVNDINEELVAQICDEVKGYLENNPNVEPRDRVLCDGIPPSTSSELVATKTANSSAPANVPARPQNVPSPTPPSNNGQDTPSSSAPANVPARPQNVPSPTPSSNNRQDSYEQALSDRRRARELNPTAVNAHINQGLTYYRRGNYQQAIISYSRALKLNPKSAKAYSNRAAAYNEQKNYQKAIDDSDKAISLIPTYVNAYINRGLAYYHQDKYQQAIADYTEAIELDPNNANAYHNRALAYTRLGNQQAAQANQRKAAALSQRQSQ